MTAEFHTESSQWIYDFPLSLTLAVTNMNSLFPTLTVHITFGIMSIITNIETKRNADIIPDKCGVFKEYITCTHTHTHTHTHTYEKITITG